MATWDTATGAANWNVRVHRLMDALKTGPQTPERIMRGAILLRRTIHHVLAMHTRNSLASPSLPSGGHIASRSAGEPVIPEHLITPASIARNRDLIEQLRNGTIG